VVIPKRNLIIMTMRGFDVLFQKEIEMREIERSEKKRWGGGGPCLPFYQSRRLEPPGKKGRRKGRVRKTKKWKIGGT
jgi:hypothetical protein